MSNKVWDEIYQKEKKIKRLRKAKKYIRHNMTINSDPDSLALTAYRKKMSGHGIKYTKDISIILKEYAEKSFQSLFQC